METRPRRHGRAVATALLMLPWPPGGLAAAQDFVRLRPGEPAAVVFDAEAEVGRLLRVLVPENATGLALATEGATLDVELYVRRGAAPEPELGLWDAGAASAWIDEELFLSRAELLEPGPWYVLVTPGYGASWKPGAGEVRCRVRADLIEPVPEPLELDAIRETTLAATTGLWSTFRVRVPAGAPLRVEAASDWTDVDLAVTPFPNGRRFERPLAGAATLRAFERLVLAAAPDERELYVHVYTLPSLVPHGTFAARVLATTAAGPEPTLAPALRVPPLDLQAPLDRAVAATVNLIGPLGGGSAVVVSPEGWVLTNAHVVVGAAARSAEDRPVGLAEISGGFTLDPRLPAIETFGLELVDVRRDLDLALLRIVSTLDGRPLPPDAAFPFVPLAPADPGGARAGVPLGTPLWILGYPMTGGSGSVLTITLTRGVVSGFAREPEGLAYKTDAAVHAGMSGGACVDAAGLLIGLPAASIADANEAGGLGFVLPIELVPGEWRQRIGH